VEVSLGWEAKNLKATKEVSLDLKVAKVRP